MLHSPTTAVAKRLSVLAFMAAAFAACSTMNLPDAPKTIGPTAKPHYKIGAPYKIDGKWYVPQVDEDYDKVGVASWYGDAFHGKLTANGEIFDKRRLSAAHKTLPLPTLVEVENLENRRKIIVRVNDRGPFVDDRIIDLSHAAADELGFSAKGLAKVRVRYLAETDVNALAALPGDKAPSSVRVAESQPKQKRERRRARGNEAVQPVAAAARESDDPLAALIADAAGAAPAQIPARPAALSEFWVEIARIDDLNELSKMRLDMPDLGPVSVQSASDNGVMRQSLRVGPFWDEAIALASLSRAQAAGFGAARIVRGVDGSL